jgi:hypothetical protein
MAVRKVGGWCEMAASLGVSQVGVVSVLLPASKGMNMVAEEAVALEAATMQQLVKI